MAFDKTFLAALNSHLWSHLCAGSLIAFTNSGHLITQIFSQLLIETSVLYVFLIYPSCEYYAYYIAQAAITDKYYAG